MIRFLLLSILLTMLYRALSRLWTGIVRGMQGQSGQGPQFRPDGARPRGVHMERDPVCGTFVVPETAVAMSGPNGTRLFFCSTACRDTFQARPASTPSAHGRTA